SPYAQARSAAGFATEVTLPIGVYSMYRLFSHTNTTGSFHTTARLSDSWNAPMLVVPSPKNATATRGSPRYCADHAAPSAMVRWAPTIAYEPITPWLTSVRCIDPPLPESTPQQRPRTSPMTPVIDVPRARV